MRAALVDISVGIPWVGVEIFVGCKLQWIDVDARDQPVALAPSLIEERGVPTMEEAHRGNKADALARGSAG